MRILEGQEKVKVPERTLGPHTKILQDEPDPHFIIWIREFESADAEAANEIASEHATRLRTRIAWRSAELWWRQQGALILLELRLVACRCYRGGCGCIIVTLLLLPGWRRWRRRWRLGCLTVLGILVLVVLRQCLLITRGRWRWGRLAVCLRDRNLLERVGSIGGCVVNWWGIGRGCCSWYRRRCGGVSDEIDFFLGVSRPEIDGEDEVWGIDVTIIDEMLA